MRLRIIACLFLSSLIISSCKKKEDESAPKIKTSSFSEVASYSVKISGSEIEGGLILEKGVCWSNGRIPDISDSHVSGGDGDSDFNLQITNLDPNMIYYARTYATNKYRTGYGQVLSFKTNPTPTLPSLQTSNPTSVTQFSASCSALLQTVTYKTITSIGFCWSTHAKPKINDFIKVYPGTVYPGSTYTTTITGLTSNTTYYLRAYATNEDGTSYGTEVQFKTTSGSVTDINGNVYGTVMIGGKEWMTENLRVNRFNDGTTIPFVNNTNSWSSLTTPGYCNYNNASTTSTPYGKLYNWYCVSSAKNIAPVGWHVSTDADWDSLESALGSDSAGIKIKASGYQYWNYGNGTNQSGFSAIGAGYCTAGQYFSQETYNAYFWIQNPSTKYLQLSSSYNYIFRDYLYYEGTGMSIRCVKD